MSTSFADVRFETGYIIYNTDGGPLFDTEVVTVDSGHESRNQNWPQGRGEWNFGDRKLPDNELEEIINFFRSRKGRSQGFRFKDWGDYQDWGAGFLGNGIGTGLPTYQLNKNYSSGTDFDLRVIKKPVAGTVSVKKNGVSVASGTSAGNFSIDNNTGVVTFVPTALSNVTSMSFGASTVLTCSSNLGLGVGKLVYLSGAVGVSAALLNGKAHPIAAVSGSGPYLVTISLVSTGYSLTSYGTAAAYPQASDVLTWAGEFDVPVRFDTDKLSYRFDSAVASAGIVSKKYFYLSALPLIEIRV